MRSARRFWFLAVSGLMLAALAGCGSSASSAPAKPAPTITPAAQVNRMLPRAIAEAHLLKIVPETLKRQFADPGTRGKAAYDAAMRRAWLASAHSTFELNADKVFVVATVNLYKSKDDARRIYRMDMTMTTPHTTTVREPVPSGSAPGSAYFCQQEKNFSGCALAWRQGSTVDLIYFAGKGRTVLPRHLAAGLGTYLHHIQVQMVGRILEQTNVAPGR